MSLFMMAARRGGWLGSPPPKKLTDWFLRLMGKPRPFTSTWAATAVNHVAFGAAAGIPFGLVAPRIPTMAARTAAGSLYGAAIRTAMYQGLLPALDLMPRPKWD